MKRQTRLFCSMVSVITLTLLIPFSGGVRGMGKSPEVPDDGKRPYEYKVTNTESRAWDREDFSLELRARRFAQGNIVWVGIKTPSGGRIKEPRLELEGLEVPIVRNGDSYEGVFAIAPGEKPGKKTLTLYRKESGEMMNYRFELNVESTEFKIYPRSLDLGRYSNAGIVPSPEVVEFIKACSAKKNEVFSRRSKGVLTGPVHHPRDMHFITSPFWAQRKYLRYRIKKGKRVYLKPTISIHRGVDLRGGRGAPVFAMAAGKVAIAERMYYEGNYIVIDHGSGVFSSYMHLDGFLVREGDKVEAGQRIGQVGSTGLSTASHLHVSFTIEGVHVDPISLLYAVP